MYIETKEIGPAGLVVDRLIRLDRDLLLEGDDKIHVDQAHLTGELHHAGEGIGFHGDIETVATIPCSRCIESCTLPLEMHFDLLYTTDADPGSDRESRVDEGEITRTSFDGVRIDLRELLSEQVYLGLPLKPLCRPGCRGLCPHCGANLNQVEGCGCPEEEPGDPRLEILKTLL